MKEPTDEQVQEFWEACEWEENIWGQKNYPELTLDNLFKYAVPKLDIVDHIDISTDPIRGERYYRVVVKHAMWGDGQNLNYCEYVGFGKDPALALFWAIYEVIKNES